MTSPADPAAAAAPGPGSARSSCILVVHAGTETAWAQWIAWQASRGGRPAHPVRMSPGQHPDLDAVLAHRSAPGDTVVLVLSRPLLDAEARDDTRWAEAVALAERRGVSLLTVLTGSGRWPAALGGLPAVDLRALGEHDAAARLSRALDLTPDPDGAGGRTVRLGEAGHLPPGRFPGLSPRLLIGHVPEPRRDWFYGRDHELDTIQFELEHTGRVALCGTSGNGKTWLAAEYLHRFLSQYDLVAWIRSEQSAMIRADLTRFARALGVVDDTGGGDPFHTAAQALRETPERFLLVFDGALPDHYSLAQPSIPGEKRVLFSELIPPDGRGHVLYTSIGSQWDTAAHEIAVRPFSASEGAAFLLRHVEGLTEKDAAEFSGLVDGSPWALNLIGHVLAQGTVTPGEYLELVRSDLAEVLDVSPPRDFKPAHGVFGPAMRLLLESPVADARLAATLLRLLTAFAPERVPLAMITSQMPGTRHEPGQRLPGELAVALGSVQRRKSMLEYITQLSLADVSIDQMGGTGPGLAVHRVTHEILLSQTPKSKVEESRHIAHAVICDADREDPLNPECEHDYLRMWRHLVPSHALSCERVTDETELCSRLPAAVVNIVNALVHKGELTAAVELADNALRAWAGRFGHDDVVIARLRIAQFQGLLLLEATSEALDSVNRVLRELEPFRDTYPREYLQAANGRAACLRVLGKWAESVASDEEVHRWAQDTLGPEHLLTLFAGHNLAVALRMMGRFREALELDTESYAGYQAHPEVGPRHWRTLDALCSVARDRRAVGEYGASARLQQQVVEMMRQVIPNPRQQYHLRARKDLAVALRRAGEHQAALELSSVFVEDFVAVYGNEHFETAAARTALATDLLIAGRHAESEEQGATAYETCVSLQPDHPFTAACAVNLAAIRRAQGRHEEAMSLDKDAVDLFATRLGDEHPYTLAASCCLATDYADAGRAAEAAILGEQTLERYRRVRGADHPYTLQCAVNLSIDLRALGRADTADALESDSLQRYSAALGDHHPDVRRARSRRRHNSDIEPPYM